MIVIYIYNYIIIYIYISVCVYPFMGDFPIIQHLQSVWRFPSHVWWHRRQPICNQDWVHPAAPLPRELRSSWRPEKGRKSHCFFWGFNGCFLGFCGFLLGCRLIMRYHAMIFDIYICVCVWPLTLGWFTTKNISLTGEKWWYYGDFSQTNDSWACLKMKSAPTPRKKMARGVQWRFDDY